MKPLQNNESQDESNIVIRYLRQDSSSDRSAQSGSLSHTHCFGIHVPEPHLN